MSRKGNCWDNAVAESFVSSLKKERIKKQIYKNRELAIADVATTSIPSTIEHVVTVISAGSARSNLKRLTNRADVVSTKSWELSRSLLKNPSV
jgi:transposase InsO family protein